MITEEKVTVIGELMEYSPYTPSQVAMIGTEEMADFNLALLDMLVESGADPQIVYDFIVINDIDVDQIIL